MTWAVSEGVASVGECANAAAKDFLFFDEGDLKVFLLNEMGCTTACNTATNNESCFHGFVKEL